MAIPLGNLGIFKYTLEKAGWNFQVILISQQIDGSVRPKKELTSLTLLGAYQCRLHFSNFINLLSFLSKIHKMNFIIYYFHVHEFILNETWSSGASNIQLLYVCMFIRKRTLSVHLKCAPNIWVYMTGFCDWKLTFFCYWFDYTLSFG